MTTTVARPTTVIDHVAEETELEPAAVERVLRLTAQWIHESIERHDQLRLAVTSSEPDVLLTLFTALAEAEREGAVDAPTMAALVAVRNLIAHGRAAESLVDVLMPAQTTMPTPAAVLQARRNAQARSALLEEFGALRSQEVADLAESRASNRAALANRWRAENRVIAVPVRDELLYPGFQFTAEGKPSPVVAAALEHLRSDPHVTDWQAALWFTSPTGWLGGRRPVDLLDEEPDAVIEAARREIADVAG
jgi:hypothetical protein